MYDIVTTRRRHDLSLHTAATLRSLSTSSTDVTTSAAQSTATLRLARPSLQSVQVAATALSPDSIAGQQLPSATGRDCSAIPHGRRCTRLTPPPAGSPQHARHTRNDQQCVSGHRVSGGDIVSARLARLLYDGLTCVAREIRPHVTRLAACSGLSDATTRKCIVVSITKMEHNS